MGIPVFRERQLEAIAKILRDLPDLRLIRRDYIVDHFEKAMAADNPKFNKKIWDKAIYGGVAVASEEDVNREARKGTPKKEG